TGMIANESHDGYIEVYAELGLCGLGLVAWLLVTAYRRSAAAFAHDWRIGRVAVAYVAALAIYNIAEAGFRMLDPPWIFLLLSFACAARVLAGPPLAVPGAGLGAAPGAAVMGRRLTVGARAGGGPSAWDDRGAL
ncbi:MAG: hypothetical protein ACREFQ_09635, partial [Stellaceae bacterium]